MTEINYLAVLVVTVAAFIVSSTYYAAFGAQLARLSGTGGAETRPPAWKLIVELTRSLAVASVVAGIAVAAGVATWTSAVLLGLAAWVGFPVVLLTGSVIWENVPWKLAALHAGDWLAKLVAVALVVGLWR